MALGPAVDFASYFPFDSGAGANVLETQWGFMARRWSPTGVLWGDVNEALNKLAVYSSADGMQVHVSNGKCWIRGVFGLIATDTILPLPAASASNRIDYIVAMVDFGANKVQLTSVTGTPSGSPVAPSLAAYQNSSQWAMPLATVLIASTDLSIPNTGRVVDKRPLALEPGKAHDTLLTAAGPATFSNGGQAPFTYGGAATRDPLGMYNPGVTDRVTVPADGIYTVDFHIEWAAHNTGFRELQLERAGVLIDGLTLQNNGAGNTVRQSFTSRRFSASRGDALRVLGLVTTSGAALGYTAGPTMGINYEGQIF